MIAWVLLATMYGHAVVVNDIDSKLDCEDLWNRLGAFDTLGASHMCVSYNKAALQSGG